MPNVQSGFLVKITTQGSKRYLLERVIPSPFFIFDEGSGNRNNHLRINKLIEYKATILVHLYSRLELDSIPWLRVTLRTNVSMRSNSNH